MNVADLGVRPGRSCSPETSLSEAAQQQRNAPGGLLALADDHGKYVGVVTDQDFVRALAQAGASAGAMPVRIFVLSSAPVCGPADDVRVALTLMRTRRVFALPVVDAAGLFQGVLSFEDLALAARPDRVAGPADLSHEDILLALKSIAAARPPLEERAPSPPLVAHL